MRLLIIRHADPDYQNDSLTEKGFRQAELLKERLIKEPIAKIYCSPLGRAKKTAQPTAEHLGIEPVILDWLCEVPASITPPYTGKPACPWELMPDYWTAQEYGFEKEKWQSMPVYAESKVPEVYARVRAGSDILLAEAGYQRENEFYRLTVPKDQADYCIAVFCHQGLGLLWMSHLLNIPATVAWHSMFISPSSVTDIYMENRRGDIAIPRSIYIGDLSHLYHGVDVLSTVGLHDRYV